MLTKNLLKIGLVAIIAAALTTVQAKPDKKKDKPEKPRPEKKIDREKMKERLKAAFDKRKKRRGDAKKRGLKRPQISTGRVLIRMHGKMLLMKRKRL